MQLNAQAEELNVAIKSANETVFNLLSSRGKAIFFPKRGILAQTADAKGIEINATIGTALEDDGSPMALKTLDSLINMNSKEPFAYAPTPGRPEIRSKWKEMLFRKNPSLANKAISNPTVTSALTHGLSMAGYLFLNEGDEIISPDYYWENYNLVFSLAYGSTIKTFTTFENNGFNIKGLEEVLLNGKIGKKIVILNFPNNPTGYTITEQEAHALSKLFIKAADAGNSIIAFIDDAYFGLVYEDGILKESIFSLLADAHERILAVKFDGPTKEDYVWGFRIGFVTFGIKNGNDKLYNALECKLGGAIRGNISNSSNVGQTMLLAAYNNKSYEQEKMEKYLILKRRYECIRDLLKSKPQYNSFFTALPFNSGYFMCIKLINTDSENLRQILLQKYSTGIIAQGDLIRIAFSATPFNKLELLFENIYNACKDLAK